MEVQSKDKERCNKINVKYEMPQNDQCIDSDNVVDSVLYRCTLRFCIFYVIWIGVECKLFVLWKSESVELKHNYF